MSSFNLLDEHWIPVRYHSGQRAEVGIRDALGRATDIVTIEDQSPLVVAALYRLLLAVLYRAFEGPTDLQGAEALFADGLQQSRITAYLDAWQQRFYLFDANRPFWQIPDYSPRKWHAWTVLAAEHNADNAKVLFDHMGVESPGSISPAAAARWLAATQTFAVSAGKSELAHTTGAPSASALMALPLARDLEDTLLLSLVPQNRAVVASDSPVWERPPESLEELSAGHERQAHGFADLYTWRTRSVRLDADEGGCVSRVAFASGVGYQTGALIDPMVGYRVDEKRGVIPVQFRDRGIWRDFDSLLPDASQLAPRVLDHATSLTRRHDARRPRAVLVLGQSTNQAKIEFWRAERFALPDSVTRDGVVRAQIRALLDEAVRTEKALFAASQSFARDIIARGSRLPSKQEIRQVTQQMGVTTGYWSALEPRFHDLLASLSVSREYEDLRAEWLMAIRDALEMSWRPHASQEEFADAWSVRALVRAEGLVLREIGRLNIEIRHLTSEEKQA